MGSQHPQWFQTRGVVVSVSDLMTLDWPTRAEAVGLTHISTHGSLRDLAEFMRSDEGHQFFDSCQQLGIEVEHECHAVRELLPRELFETDTSMFRMNDEGERTPDCNLCVHSETALDVVCENAAHYAEALRPTTGRYYFWIDDAQPMCRCPECRGYSDSEQSLILENRLIGALQACDPSATLAHLAYLRALDAPVQIAPHPGVFLEYAPIMRRYDVPFSQRDARLDRPDVPTHGEQLDALDANLSVFGTNGAQVLEYWIDVSRFSNWRRETLCEIPWDSQVFSDDLQTYAERGIQHFKSFAVWLDGEYVRRFGEPPLAEYGAGMR